MPVARRCSGCGAALGAPTDDDLTVVCPFCGLRHDLNALTPPATAPGARSRTPGSTRGGTVVTIIVLLIVAATTAGGLYVASRSADDITSRVTSVTDAVRPAAVERNRPVTMAELGTLAERGWKMVDTPPPPGGYESFDPVAALPWAMAIGQAWAPDAMLTRIDVGRVSATGVVDISGDAPSGYRFASPARLLRWKQEADSGTTSETSTELMLQVQADAVRVLVGSSARAEPARPAPVSLPLPELLTRARTRRGFADRPFYAGYLIFLPREGWAWYFRGGAGDSFPRVRAKDGRTYPY